MRCATTWKVLEHDMVEPMTTWKVPDRDMAEPMTTWKVPDRDMLRTDPHMHELTDWSVDQVCSLTQTKIMSLLSCHFHHTPQTA